MFAADVGANVADVDDDAFDDVGNLIGGAEGIVTAAVSGLMSRGKWITTVPKSNGPTWALVIETTEKGEAGVPAVHAPLPLYGPPR